MKKLTIADIDKMKIADKIKFLEEEGFFGSLWDDHHPHCYEIHQRKNGTFWASTRWADWELFPIDNKHFFSDEYIREEIEQFIKFIINPHLEEKERELENEDYKDYLKALGR